MTALIVGLYTRTSILTNKYDRYEKALLLYCKQQGWDNVRYYRDRIGERIDQNGFDALEQGWRKGNIDSDVLERFLERLIQQQDEDDLHNRDAFFSMLHDAGNGTIDAMVVHDVGQLGRNRSEVFRAVDAMLQTGRKLFILRLGEIRRNTPLFDSSPIDSQIPLASGILVTKPKSVHNYSMHSL